MDITTVIFDLDGTLLNTLADITNSVNYALQKNGFASRTLDEVKSFVGNGAAMLIKRALPNDSEFDAVFADYMTHYSVHSNDNTKPYDGVLDSLKQLKILGLKTAVLSNKPDAQTKLLVKQVFGDLINIPQGQLDAIPEKPAPDGVYALLKQLNSQPDQTIFVGDSDVDILTGKNANLYTVGVSWGFRSVAQLNDVGADKIINNMRELINLVE